jgi:hypothetical protein
LLGVESRMNDEFLKNWFEELFRWTESKVTVNVASLQAFDVWGLDWETEIVEERISVAMDFNVTFTGFSFASVNFRELARTPTTPKSTTYESSDMLVNSQLRLDWKCHGLEFEGSICRCILW